MRDKEGGCKKKLVEDGNKSFDGDNIHCDQCAWNGIPDQKVIIVYLGISPANQPGFIYKFETYDYSENGDKKIHQHKYNRQVIDRLVDIAPSRKKATSQ